MSETSVTGSSVALTAESPAFAIPRKKLAMWLFIVSDGITFGVFLFAYGFLRNAASDWPRPFGSATVINVYTMTFILVSSSLTMLLAIRAARTGDPRKALSWTRITITGGIVFASLHLKEWMGLVAAGLRMFANPWGSGLFGAAFFSITGLHLAHVAAGCVGMGIVSIGYKRGRYDHEVLEICGLYWHFVDVLWLFVVPLMYLLNVKH